MNNTPIYDKTLNYAVANGELEKYRASFRTNIACKTAITEVLDKHYKDNRLNAQKAFEELKCDFSLERIALIVAVTVREKDWDGRISSENKKWAKSIPFPKDIGDWGFDRNAVFYVSGIHPGIIDLFADTLRTELENTRTVILKKSSLVAKIQRPLAEGGKNLSGAKAQER